MIELTTGVVFLVTSMYGTGTADTHLDAITLANATDKIVQTASTTDENSLTKSETKSDPRSLEAYLRQEFKNEPILVDIARCESNYKQFDANGNVIRGRVDKDDIGVMQINQRYWGASAQKLGIDIYTTDGNIAYAKRLYNNQGTAPWSASKPCWGKSELAKN